MKLDDVSPPRLEEEGPEALRALIRSHQLGPTDAVLERMSQRLTVTLDARVSSRELVSPVAARFVHYKFLLALGLTIAGGLAFSWSAHHPTRSDASIGSAVPADPSNADVLTTRKPLPGPPEGPAVVSVNQLPTVTPAPTSNASVTSGRAPTKSKAPQASPSTELDIIQRAQAALSSSPTRALAIANEHAQAYPSGEFVQEREVIAVEALAKLGQRAEASQRALSLAQRFPNTPYAARLEKAVGQPLRRLPLDAEGAGVTP